ncbi:hypothetical protein D910_01876 [Dendroctonus ponderosae]
MFINEEEVKSVLNWDDTLEATETALRATSERKSVQPPRVFAQIFNTPKWMIAMPGYLEDSRFGGWACKILSGNPQNVHSPTMSANIVLYDEDSGVLKAVLSAIEITSWRTAAASAVATKHLHVRTGKPQKILAIFGCGDQGKAHANCFYHCFNFEEIRLWNRTHQKAANLAAELNNKYHTLKFRAFEGNESCARDADVIVTATSPGPVPIVRSEWLKAGVHINAIGVVTSKGEDKRYELSAETYKNAAVYVDSWEGANKELTGLLEFGAEMKAEIGDVILGNVQSGNKDRSIFQSLGMAAEDCAMARLVYDLHKRKQTKVL